MGRQTESVRKEPRPESATYVRDRSETVRLFESETLSNGFKQEGC